jgi:arylsulfatase A-like enzyme
MPVNTPDLMPTLLGLSGIEIPDEVEGTDYSDLIKGQESGTHEAALIACPVPFHQWSYERGGREYRGVRTRRYTYVRDLKGPWLLYDNQTDPYQRDNLVGRPDHARLQRQLDAWLEEWLERTKDEFLPGPDYMKRWGYGWDGSDAPRD